MGTQLGDYDDFLRSKLRFDGAELKESDYRQACLNLARAKADQGALFKIIDDDTLAGFGINVE